MILDYTNNFTLPFGGSYLNYPMAKTTYVNYGYSCYAAANPLIVKDYSLAVTTSFQLNLPLPEMIYADVTNNSIIITLPNINVNFGTVPMSSLTCRFYIRQIGDGDGHAFYLQTFTGSIPPNAMGGTIYNALNVPQTSPYTSNTPYNEVHFYNGNWYINSFIS